MIHTPVLKKEVIEYLNPKKGEKFIDCTIDGGGHSLAILEKIGSEGKILGIDQDEELIERLKKEKFGEWFKDNLILVCDNFENLKRISEENKFDAVSGILFDLGMSTWHFKESGRGFSFQDDEILDMRYDVTKNRGSTVREIINKWPEKKISQILREYGEEKFSDEIAQEVVNTRGRRPIETTFQLVSVINKAVPDWYKRRKIHPATKTFQALRIVVNDELGSLERALPQALEALGSGGRLVIISFHSLEDKIVKNFFREKGREGKIKILTKKPVRPRNEEIQENPSCRSARLRVAVKI